MLQLEVEEAALSKEEATDPSIAARLQAVRGELQLLHEQRNALEGEFKRSQGLLDELAKIKKDIEDT